MYEGLLGFGIPVVMILIFIYFLWAWILMTVKPPKEAEEKKTGAKLYARWRHLEAEPEGVRKRVAQEAASKRKAA